MNYPMSVIAFMLISGATAFAVAFAVAFALEVIAVLRKRR
jgi:hypothetical protein